MYLVMASNGEYSDRMEWPVAVYRAEADAKRHALAAGAFAREWEKNVAALDWDESETESWEVREYADGKSPFDPHFRGVDETHYYVVDVPEDGPHVEQAKGVRLNADRTEVIDWPSRRELRDLLESAINKAEREREAPTDGPRRSR